MPLIRHAVPADLPGLVELRNHYVLNSRATFDTELHTVDSLRPWLQGYATQGRYQLLVADVSGVVAGYCCSQPYRAHPAFARTIETSIYIAPGCTNQGLGRALYESLFHALRDEGLHRAYVGIALPNPGSVALHARFGFREVGVFHEYAEKHGERVSSVWMERALSGGLLPDSKQPD